MNIEELNQLNSGDPVFYLGQKGTVSNTLDFSCEIAFPALGNAVPDSLTITEKNVGYLFAMNTEILTVARLYLSNVVVFIENKPSNINEEVDQRIKDFWIEMCEASAISSSKFVDIREDFLKFMNEIYQKIWESTLSNGLKLFTPIKQ